MRYVHDEQSYLCYQFPEGVRAFSTCRHGGVSEGDYTSFNCTHYCGDNVEHVMANRRKLCNDWHISTERLVIPRQVHGTEVAVIDDRFLSLPLSEQTEILDGVDALISPLTDVCLAVSTADCIPVLIYDRRNHIIAAIHAGWRGTVARIVSHTIRQMKRLYGVEGCEMFAAIGPGISLDAFEVGDEVYDAFCDASFPMEKIATHTEKWHIDLWEANRLQLIAEGVRAEQIELSGICTYEHYQQFFSARRLGIQSGRILTGIIQ